MSLSFSHVLTTKQNQKCIEAAPAQYCITEDNFVLNGTNEANFAYDRLETIFITSSYNSFPQRNKQQSYSRKCITSTQEGAGNKKTCRLPFSDTEISRLFPKKSNQKELLLLR